jgi:hypothetical protein
MADVNRKKGYMRSAFGLENIDTLGLPPIGI